MALRYHEVLRDSLARTFVSHGRKVRPAWLGKHAVRELGLDPEQPEDLRLATAAICRLFGDAPVWQPGQSAPAMVEAPTRFGRFAPRWARVDAARRAATIAEARPCIVLATSGNADGGPVQAWLARWLRDARATVLFAGHCPRGSLGATLQALGELSATERLRVTDVLTIAGTPIAGRDIQARITKLHGYSAHADQAGLVDWAFPVKDGQRFPVARHLALTHGDASPRRCLEEAIATRARAEGFTVNVILPRPGGDAIDARTGAPVSRDEVLGRSVDAHADLVRQMLAMPAAERDRLLARIAAAGTLDAHP